MTETFDATHIPTEIRLNKADKTLDVTFDNGESFTIAAELLRVESPSAEVQGHGPDEKKIVAGKRNVAITGVTPVGNYAVSISFDDDHDSGIYSWDTLYDFGAKGDAMMAAYLEALNAAGLSRD